MISKELHNSDFIFYSENIMTDVSRIIVKYRHRLVGTELKQNKNIVFLADIGY